MLCLSSQYTRWPFQLDNVSVGVFNVKGKPISFGAEVDRSGTAWLDIVLREVATNDCLVERFDAQAKMVQVPCAGSRSGPAFLAERSFDGHEIDHRCACLNMNESEVVSSPCHLASKDVHVKIHGRFEIANPKNEMVDALSLKWDHMMWPSRAAGPARSLERLTYAPPALADFADACLPCGSVLEEIRRCHERPDLTEFELYGCLAKFRDLEHACQLKAREIILYRFGVYAIHWNFRAIRLN